MKEGTLLMSRKDCRKVQVLSRVKEKLITVGRASELLGDEGIALLDKAAKKLCGLSADR